MKQPTAENAHRALTQDQIDTFRQQGFISVGPILDDDTLTELRGEYDRLFDEGRDTSKYRNLSADAGAAQRQDEGAAEEMLQIMQCCERSLAFRRLLYHDGILDAIEDLIGAQIQLFHDQALFKPAHHGGPIHWHQDNGYWKCLPANLVSCWLTLDDVDVSNGAMHLIPASHLAAHGHERGDVLLDASEAVGGIEPVIVNLPAGGAMIHHCQTLHSTPPNRTDRQRRAFAMHYMTPGTRNALGDMPVSFARPLLRSR